MFTPMNETRQQASDYVKRVGTNEAKKSNHYLTAIRHCKCGECFCCYVRMEVQALEQRVTWKERGIKV